MMGKLWALLSLFLTTRASAFPIEQCSFHVIDAMRVVPATGRLPIALDQPVAAAKGELVHVQAVLLRPTGTAQRVSAAVGESSGALATVRQVQYTFLNKTFAKNRQKGFYPDALLPGEGQSASLFDLSKGSVFWVSIRIPRGMNAGIHRGAIKGCAVNNSAICCQGNFEVKVANFSLPATPTQLTGASFSPKNIQLFSDGEYTPKNGPYTPETALQFFESYQRQGVTISPWEEPSNVPFDVRYRFNEERTAVILNTTLHERYWPKVLA